MKLKLILASAVVLCTTACQKEILTTEEKTTDTFAALSTTAQKTTKVFKGPQVNVGNGKARSVITLDEFDKPVSLTIEMTNAALTGLPEDEAVYLLPLHQKAKDLTPFNHISAEWNPHGHIPANVYDLPHFDFHFFKISVAERQAILPYSAATAAQYDHLPPAGYMPPTYIPTPGGEALQGKHWIDFTSPEFNGQAFTKTFIYGTYDGRVTFYEPMITLAYLESGVTSQTSIPSPQYFSPINTYYPTVYRIGADANNHYVNLSDFILR